MSILDHNPLVGECLKCNCQYLARNSICITILFFIYQYQFFGWGIGGSGGALVGAGCQILYRHQVHSHVGEIVYIRTFLQELFPDVNNRKRNCTLCDTGGASMTSMKLVGNMPFWSTFLPTIQPSLISSSSSITSPAFNKQHKYMYILMETNPVSVYILFYKPIC